MIEMLPISSDSCLVTHFSGKVTSQEYQQFLDALAVRFQNGEPVSLVIELTGFEFYGDFDAAKRDFKFAFHEYKDLHRVALVGDQKWIGWFTRLIGPFTRAEEMNFPAGQVEAAFDWACTTEG